MTYRVVVTVVAAALAVGAASAEPVECTIADCQVGRTVWSAPASGGAYFVCPTAELSEYVNSVLGLVSLAHSLGSPVPGPSPITGEPSYTGETRALLDTYARKPVYEHLTRPFHSAVRVDTANRSSSRQRLAAASLSRARTRHAWPTGCRLARPI